jgi:hypothetical protein
VFAPGAVAKGHITYPGYEHYTFERVAPTRRALDEISRRWDEALDRLKRYVEE